MSTLSPSRPSFPSFAPAPRAPAWRFFPAPRALPSAEAAAPAREAGSHQLVTWNRLRILACIDVVSFHLTGYHALAAIGLPTSLVIAFALGARQRVQPPFEQFLRVRLSRLIVPWAFWSAMYGALLALSAWRKHEPLTSRFDPMMLLYGTSQGLWFLPAMVLGAVIAYAIDRHTRRVPLPVFAAVCACFTILLLGPHWQASPQLVYPLPQWRFALSALPIGLLFGRLLAHSARTGWRALFALGAVAALLPLALGQDPLAGTGQLAGRYGLTACLLALGAGYRARPDALTARIEPLLLGIYILHFPIYEYGLRAPLARLGWQPPAALMVACTLLATGLAVALLKRTPLRRVV